MFRKTWRAAIRKQTVTKGTVDAVYVVNCKNPRNKSNIKRMIRMKNKALLILFFVIVFACIGCANATAPVANNDESDTYFINSVNHRGWCDAPENTLVAYRESAQNGFNMVECDVSFTKDNVPVLLHDKTIDRTSNGQGLISELMWSEVCTYDFGSWKSEKYAGEKIPKFEEFISLCRNLSLHPYIEIKSQTKVENIKILVDTVVQYGMMDRVTWIAWNVKLLSEVCRLYPKSRIGYIVTELSSDAIESACSLQTETNSVFIDCSYSAVNSDGIESCIEKSIPLEVWTVNDIDTILNLDPYISGVTSDKYIAGEIIKSSPI